jgi:ABC-type Fe3+ transport system permease subunit
MPSRESKGMLFPNMIERNECFMKMLQWPLLVIGLGFLIIGLRLIPDGQTQAIVVTIGLVCIAIAVLFLPFVEVLLMKK